MKILRTISPLLIAVIITLLTVQYLTDLYMKVFGVPNGLFAGYAAAGIFYFILLMVLLSALTTFSAIILTRDSRWWVYIVGIPVALFCLADPLHFWVYIGPPATGYLLGWGIRKIIVSLYPNFGK